MGGVATLLASLRPMRTELLGVAALVVLVVGATVGVVLRLALFNIPPGCLDTESLDPACFPYQFAAYEYQTSSTTILRFSNGSVGKCAAIVDCLQPYYFHTHLVGSEGSLLDNKFHSQKLPGLDRHAWSGLSMKMLDSGDVGDHPYQTQFQAFFDALDAGFEMPLTSFADAFETHRVIAAADSSAAQARSVKISEVPIE